jgi:hypothetical protein
MSRQIALALARLAGLGQDPPRRTSSIGNVLAITPRLM